MTGKSATAMKYDKKSQNTKVIIIRFLVMKKLIMFSRKQK